MGIKIFGFGFTLQLSTRFRIGLNVFLAVVEASIVNKGEKGKGVCG